MDRPAVCHVLEASFAGVARHVIDLARGQRARGQRVAVVVNPRRLDEVSRAEFAGLPDFGIPIAELPMDRAVSTRDIGTAIRLRSAIHALGSFDVIHAHSSKAGALTRALVSIRLGKTVKVYTPHALYTLDPKLGERKRALFVRVERALARRCDAIILVSQDEYDHALKIGLPAAKLRKVLNGVTLEPTGKRSVARAALGLPEDRTVIGFVGRFSSQKDPVAAVEAFRAFAATHPSPCELVMVGDGERRAEVEAAAVGLPVRLLGAVDARAVFPAFDVFLLTSRYEGCCYVILEALANGVPVAATPVGDSAPSVVEGFNGALAPVGDTPAMTAALSRATAIDRAGLHDLTYLNEYGVDRMIERIDAVYREALEARRPRPVS